MGFAYQAVPRFKFVTLWRPRLACATMWLFAPALAVRATADLFLPARAWLGSGQQQGAPEFGSAGAWLEYPAFSGYWGDSANVTGTGASLSPRRTAISSPIACRSTAASTRAAQGNTSVSSMPM